MHQTSRSEYSLNTTLKNKMNRELTRKITRLEEAKRNSNLNMQNFDNVSLTDNTLDMNKYATNRTLQSQSNIIITTESIDFDNLSSSNLKSMTDVMTQDQNVKNLYDLLYTEIKECDKVLHSKSLLKVDQIAKEMHQRNLSLQYELYCKEKYISELEHIILTERSSEKVIVY